jgi:hypothetical protein
MNDLLKMLERIAVALEKIADIKSDGQKTRFPWGDPRLDSRLIKELHWHDARPETFGALLAIGRRSLSTGKSGLTRNIGRAAIATMDAVFESQGLGDQWMKS